MANTEQTHTESVHTENTQAENVHVENICHSFLAETRLTLTEQKPPSHLFTADNIIDVLVLHYPSTNKERMRKAYDFASAAHVGQMRMSGEPYFLHPAAVAMTLAEMGFDEHAVAAGLLHDTVEDTSASIEEIDSEFGEQVADIVDGVTKISLMTFDSKEEAQAENIRKMILAMSHDMRVPIVKLADRQHNMRTLEFQKPHKRILISQETMDIYAPLANRLGLHRVKQELEDLSFRYLQPDRYAQIREWLDENQVVERQIIAKVIGKLDDIMKENKIDGCVFGRIKQIYSIFIKMEEQKTSLDEMHDIIAFRVIVQSLQDCYAVLGLVHALWRPVAGRFKDYISMPKANGYQSLHSTVIGPEGERIEIQIRTQHMNELAEHGVASHWLYKERNHTLDSKDMPQFEWLRELMDRQRDESDSKEFMQSLRLDLFSAEVYVFTPKGLVKQLPDGATPLDFAFLVHTDVGMHCAGAKINGKLRPLSTPLKSGDTVDIFTDKNRNPSRDWLKIVKTAKARNRIQHYLRTEERSAAVTLGKQILEKEGRRMSVNISSVIKDGSLSIAFSDFSVGSLDELYAALGYTRFTPRKFLRRFQQLINHDEDAEIKPTPKENPATKASPEGIVVQGLSDTLIHFAKCCNPVPGDTVIGFVSRGRGVIVHVSRCPNIQEAEAERLISVTWENQKQHPFPARVHITAKNQKGLMSKISADISDSDINITAITAFTTVDGRFELDITVEVNDAVHLYQVMDKIRKIPEIIDIRRSYTED